ncbi:DEAD/DEAH box helicase family protein [Candidatus Uhrbacteria bacterium]|nr:DEAD/DEAH box helicase family protein [Candidatus Uhrbacteria bacterium]
MFSRVERVQIFISRFAGRTDVFARRWEKWQGGVSGYAPLYTDQDKESYVPLSDDWIEKHLIGTAALGIYPLLQDNTSNFIVADFDGNNWQNAVRKFLDVCKIHALPVATERSRSGNGAHVWCFFSAPYPAYRSRHIFLSLLREAGCIDPLEKNEGFDRLFPNQDCLSGKGLGNLIALPLQGESRKHGNTIFVDPDKSFEPVPDQWEYLSVIQRVNPERLNGLVAHDTPMEKIDHPTKSPRFSNSIVMTLGSIIALPKIVVPPHLASFLREELNILNIGYVVKERAGLPTYGEKKFIKTLEQTDDAILVPRGFLKRLCAWLDEQSLKYRVIDKRQTLDPIGLNSSYVMLPYQNSAVASFNAAEQGILVAPAGAGKTFVGLEIIARKRQPAIILTHRRQIYDQWLERIEHGFGIPKTKIGQIGGVKKDARQPITVAMVQTLAHMKDIGHIVSMFGTVLIDECHHMPSRMFRDVVSKFPARYRFGLTATPSRKYNDEKLIGVYLGDVIHTVDKSEIRTLPKISASAPEGDAVIVRTTNLATPFGATSRDFQLISKVLSSDANRNALIAADVAQEAKNGKKCLVLTERKEHAEMLRAYLRKDFETIMFSGDLSARQRSFALQKIKGGRFRILIATGQILGEGADIADLEVLFLAFPVSFHGKLAQYVGRIRREGGAKLVYDYRDAGIPILEKLWKKRATYYRKNGFSFTDTPSKSQMLLQ